MIAVLAGRLGRAARCIRSDWERETWDRRNRNYNVAVSELLTAVAMGDGVAEAADRVARAYLNESA